MATAIRVRSRVDPRRASAPPATLRQFVEILEHSAPRALEGYVRRGDFSRWIADVYGDYALAEDLREHERRFRTGLDGDTLPEMVSAVRARYDLTEDAPP